MVRVSHPAPKELTRTIWYARPASKVAESALLTHAPSARLTISAPVANAFLAVKRDSSSKTTNASAARPTQHNARTQTLQQPACQTTSLISESAIPFALMAPTEMLPPRPASSALKAVELATEP